MAREITQRELRNGSGEVMRGLDDGNSFVVTRNGVAVADLTPVRPRTFVSADALVASFAELPAIDGAQLRRDLDALVDQDPTPRA